jgi:hypothetical protein
MVSARVVDPAGEAGTPAAEASFRERTARSASCWLGVVVDDETLGVMWPDSKSEALKPVFPISGAVRVTIWPA